MGAYALAVIDFHDPDHPVVAREGSPLVIAVGFSSWPYCC